MTLWNIYKNPDPSHHSTHTKMYIAFSSLVLSVLAPIDLLMSPLLRINGPTFFPVGLYTDLLSKQGQWQVCWEHTPDADWKLHCDVLTGQDSAAWTLTSENQYGWQIDLGEVIWLADSIWNLIYWQRVFRISLFVPNVEKYMSSVWVLRQVGIISLQLGTLVSDNCRQCKKRKKKNKKFVFFLQLCNWWSWITVMLLYISNWMFIFAFTWLCDL